MCGDILNFWGVRHDKLVIFPLHVICFYATNKGKKTKRITRKKRVPPEYHIEAQYDKKKVVLRRKNILTYVEFVVIVSSCGLYKEVLLK